MFRDNLVSRFKESVERRESGYHSLTAAEVDVLFDESLVESFEERFVEGYNSFMVALEDSSRSTYLFLRKLGLPKPYPYMVR